MVPKKKAGKRPKKDKKVPVRKKQVEKKTRLRDQVAALTARVEALETQVAELHAAKAPTRPAAEPLTIISGIGFRYAERLRGAGVASIADLVTADPETLAERTGIPLKTIQAWIDAAGASRGAN